jgi:GLPGLI family protein
VVYERTTTYSFEPTGIDEWDAYSKTLPTEGKFEKVLYFTAEASLYIDFQKESKAALREYMTREFLVDSPLENRGWKLNPTRRKIGEYVCMKATMNLEGDTVTAWFAPEIAVPAGPAEYYVLPGVVLAVERLGETVLLAASIDLTPPPT